MTWQRRCRSVVDRAPAGSRPGCQRLSPARSTPAGSKRITSGGRFSPFTAVERLLGVLILGRIADQEPMAGGSVVHRLDLGIDVPLPVAVPGAGRGGRASRHGLAGPGDTVLGQARQSSPPPRARLRSCGGSSRRGWPRASSSRRRPRPSRVAPPLPGADQIGRDSECRGYERVPPGERWQRRTLPAVLDPCRRRSMRAFSCCSHAAHVFPN